VIRLPGDVLFAFGSAELTPAARDAIAAVDDEIGGGTGTVTIEGHTDAIGSDADNQALSERRAAAVRGALERRWIGLPVHVGRLRGDPARGAQHQAGRQRRPGRPRAEPAVEIRTGSAEPGPPPRSNRCRVNRDLADAGLRAEVAGSSAARGT
jgi:flagellar motor protein MotB